MRLIDEDALRRYCEKRHCGSVPLEYIKQMPTVFAEPVRNSHWIDSDGLFTCAHCGAEAGVMTSYCADCGYKMDGGADNG